MRIGVYEMESLVGAGAMGEVHRARDTKLGRLVAVKILPPALTADAARLARFEREARLLASLNHPNIATIHGFEESGGVHAIVMELVDGVTLAEAIADGPLSPPEALQIARQIADALDAAHERGVIHRDLKPGNIKLRPDGTVKVLDFGLAKGPPPREDDISQSPTIADDETRDGVILGTAAYMSPEQARGKPVDKRADIWGFGCVLYEMLTGCSPFRRETVSDTIAAILNSEPDFAMLPPAVPAHVRRVLARCLTRDLRLRVRDIGDVRAELDELREPTPERASRSSRMPWLIAAVSVAAAVAAIAWSTRRSATLPSVPTVPTNLSVSQLTNEGSHETDGAIAPSGRSFAFVSDRAGQSDIWLRQVVGGEPIRLTTDGGSKSELAFSPDGESIYFTRADDAGRSIWMVGALGGVSRKVIAAGHAAAPSADGTRLAYMAPEPDGRETLMISGMDGSSPRAVAQHIQNFPPVRPAWSRSGRYLSFVQAGLFASANLFTVDVQSGEQRQITRFASAAGVGQHVWLPGDSYIATSFAPEARSQPKFDIGLLAVATGTVTRVTTTIGGSFRAPTLSADGTRLVATMTRQIRDVWKMPTGKDPDANGRAAVQLIDAVKDPLWTYVTRDGHTLLFNSPATGSRNLWVLSLNAGGDAHQITSLPGDIVGHASLSPDGRRVAFISFAGGRSDVWTQNVDGSDPLRLTNDPDADSWPVWSPDGKSIVFSSIRQGTQTIQLVPTAGGPSEKVMDGFFRGDWIRTADGRSLLITNQSNPPVLRLVDMDRRTMIWQKPLPGGVDTMPMFSSDGRSISVAVETDRSGAAIHVVDVDTGESKVVARLPFRIMFRASWTADAGFLVNRADTESHIVLLDNFWPAAPAN